MENWVSRTNYPALNIVQTSSTEMSIYVNQDYAQPSAHLHRYTLRLDGFASVSAPYDGGELITRPFIFSGEQLYLNFATAAAGSIKVYLVEAEEGSGEHPILAGSVEIIGNEIERVVRWNNVNSLKQFAGKPVRLSFLMQDADLYSFRFGE